MREYELSDHLKKVFKKLSKKDKLLYEAAMKKIRDILMSDNLDEQYKNLKYGMKGSKRVHVGSFVLVFRVVGEKLYFDDFDHHDKIYS
jgi:YafQ family addiction module toxin component